MSNHLLFALLFDGGLDTLPNSPVGGAELLLLLLAPPKIEAELVLGLPPNILCPDATDPKMLPVVGVGVGVFIVGAALFELDDKLKLAKDNGAESAELPPNILPVVGCGG